MAICSMCGHEITADNGVCSECGELEFYFEIAPLWIFNGNKPEVKQARIHVTKNKIVAMPSTNTSQAASAQFGIIAGIIGGISAAKKQANMWKYLILSKKLSDIESLEWPINGEYKWRLAKVNGDKGVLISFKDGEKVIFASTKQNNEYMYRELKMRMQ